MIHSLIVCFVCWVFFGLTAFVMAVYVAWSSVRRSFSVHGASLEESRSLLATFKEPWGLFVLLFFYALCGPAAFIDQVQRMFTLWWFLEYAEEKTPEFFNADEEREWWKRHGRRLACEFEELLKGERR